MVQRNDILSMEYLKKTEFTGSHQGMRYRLEGVTDEAGEKRLRCTVWPEPFHFFATSPDQKEAAEFPFAEDGVAGAVAWMNDKLVRDKDKWEHAENNWDR